MDTLKTLDKQTMDSVKELSQISLKIGEGRAVLSKIKEGTAIYLDKREKEAIKRVNKALKESKDVLTEIDKNALELSTFKNEIIVYVETVKEFYTGLEGVKEALDKAILNFDTEVEQVYKDIKETKNTLKVERSAIQSERESLSRESIHIQSETRLLNDRRETLERGFKELRKLKAK